MTSSQNDSNIDHDVRFRHEVLKGFAEDLQDLASNKEKQDLLVSIKSFAFYFIKEPLKRPMADFPKFDLVYKELYTGQHIAGNWESYGFARSLQMFWEELVKEGSEAELRSLATFSAKILAAGICEEQISSTALWYMCEALETSDNCIAKFLPGAVAWMELCPHALLKDCVLKADKQQSSLNLGPLAQGQRVDESGFSIAR
nr:hypothetical protein FVER53263_08573 [Fusarium verticillioides]